MINNMWHPLETNQQLDEVVKNSFKNPQLIFKYSSRCSVSDMAFQRFEKEWHSENIEHITPVFLDILSFRSISNAVESFFKVRHESPQILLIKNGECVFHASHFGIDCKEITIYDQEVSSNS